MVLYDNRAGKLKDKEIQAFQSLEENMGIVKQKHTHQKQYHVNSFAEIGWPDPYAEDKIETKRGYFYIDEYIPVYGPDREGCSGCPPRMLLLPGDQLMM